MASLGIHTGGIGLGDSHAFGVFNNSIDGSWLVLWDFKFHFWPSDTGNTCFLIDMGHLQGHGGNPLTPGRPLVALAGQVDGAVWDQANFQDFTDDFIYFTGNPGTFSWNHDWPIAAVPPGWSLVAITDGNPITEITVNFIWEMTPAI